MKTIKKGSLVRIYRDGSLIGEGKVVALSHPDGVWVTGDERKGEVNFGPEWFPQSNSTRLEVRPA